MRMHLTQAADAMSAKIFGPAIDVELAGAAMDSRAVRPGDVFFCLPGARADGHDFAGQALRAGAAAVVADRRLPDVEAHAPVLLVQDTLRSLGELGRAWRLQTAAKVVGVTGSAGKTTSKEMLAQVCSLAGETCKNHLNWNNQIGLPMSLLACTGQERFWIMEAGISRPGDMEALGRILVPDAALVVNVGPAHLEALGSVAKVAQAKASLLAYLRKDNAALVNRDCEELWRAARDVLPGVHGFSTRDRTVEFYGHRVDGGAGRVCVELFLRGRLLELSWSLFDAPLLENVVAVAGTAVLLGIDHQVIGTGLRNYRAEACVPQGRFQITRHGGWLLIDDTYNANPLSMANSLARARELADEQPLVCVLGDMLELNGEAANAHRELGQNLAQIGCAAVLFHGSHALDVYEGLSSAGWSGLFMVLESPEALLKAWKNVALASGVALFKGSRAGAMETFFNALRAKIAT